MQQAYQAIRVVSEAQTIRIGLSTDPDELMLHELCAVCASLTGSTSDGIKAVVLDFNNRGKAANKDVINHAPTDVKQACSAIHDIVQPVLAVARDTLSPIACKLLSVADFMLVAEHAGLTIASRSDEQQEETLTGAHAARLGYITWSVPASDISKEMERILNMLREKSAVALRYAKAGTRLGQSGQSGQSSRLEALQRINSLYLDEVMHTKDAAEGLRAFLEKRKPTWKNM